VTAARGLQLKSGATKVSQKVAELAWHNMVSR
jgi:hypothetical protein